ncbi:hypothetical protein MVEN_02206700 [Mycena venus]|uniref:F-box domain-containing protein n=1 Tax=Mycena venus TaxID=2733690 RepID=A0A8H7CFA5_9AGAR|nr:hypothetical protein MVEN_02206700 [Mycena venus]
MPRQVEPALSLFPFIVLLSVIPLSLDLSAQMSSRMPPELTDRIIDFLWDSQTDLQACSLVCSQWLPSSRHHIFDTIAVRLDARFLTLLKSPSNVVTNHTRNLNFRLWPSEIDDTASQILRHLPSAQQLRAVTVGSLPASLEDFPVLFQVAKLSLQHTKFTTCTDFVGFLSKFPNLRELGLGWVTWADYHYDVWPRFTLELESLSIQGFEQAPDVLQWLSSAHYAPRAREIVLYMPNSAPDPTSLSVISKFLHGLEGHLESLRLDVHPSTHLKWTIMVLDLGSLEGLQRLRIGHGIHFYPPSIPAAQDVCRVFPDVLEIAIRLTPRNRLTELVFDVDISPDMWSSNSNSFFKTVLTNAAVAQIPIVRFHVLQGRQSSDAVARHRRHFASFMHRRGFRSPNIIYSDECRGNQ